MIAAFDTYIKYVPDSNELPNIKYRKARIYYEYNHFDEAVPLFKDIVEHHSTSDLAYYSTNLIFDCLSIMQKFDELQASIDEFCPMYSEKDPTVKSQCATLKTGLTRKRIEMAEKDGQVQGGGAALPADRGRGPRTTPKLDELYYNAAVDFERAKLLGSAIQAPRAPLKARAGLDAGEEGDLSDRP